MSVTDMNQLTGGVIEGGLMGVSSGALINSVHHQDVDSLTSRLLLTFRQKHHS